MKILNLVIKHKLLILFFLTITFVIFTNQIHFFFTDEFENIMGGRFISRGMLPYKDFFTHHNPFAYFLAYPLVIFGGPSFVRFRLLMGIIYLLSAIGFYRFFIKRYGDKYKKLLIVLILFFTFGATYFWGHMLLADSLSGYLLVVPYLLVFLNIYEKKEFNLRDIWIISIFTSLSLLTSSVMLYSGGVLYLAVLFLYAKTGIKKIWKALLIFGLPYLIFLIYLVISSSLDDFYAQAIRYNTDIYAVLPGGVQAKNPMRIAISVVFQFLEHFKIIMNQIKDLSFERPLAHALALSNIALWVFLFLKKKFLLLTFSVMFLIFLTVRGNPAETAESDFHLFGYQHISIINGLFALLTMWASLNTEKLFNKKVIYSFFTIILGLYLSALLFHLFERWGEKTYLKYMGKQALIYDWPPVANQLNSLLSPNDYYYVGPFDYQDQIYLESKPASRYHVVLIGFDKSPEIQSELMNDIKKNRPKIIVYNTDKTMFTQHFGSYFVDYLRDQYFTLEEIDTEKKGYNLKDKWLDDFDFERHFFFDKNRKEELLKLLKDKGFI